MRWIREHTRLTLAGVAAVVLLVLILASVAGGAGNPVGKFFQSVAATVQKPFAMLGNTIGSGVSGILTDDGLKQENEGLKEQVASLERELTEARLDETELSELSALRDAFGAGPASGGQYTMKAANVLSYDGSNKFNVFTIDIGEEAGVKHDSIVVTGDGLVGRVYETGGGWSKVVSIISDSNNVGFQVYPELNYIGVCRGDGKGGLAGEMLDENAVVEKGQKLLTSGIGGIYPSGLEIGTISTVEHEESGSLLKVVIEPSVYFKGLKKVAVLV
ncbi:MAG: rod shape-determining protein MreC [Clostridiales Family XIII bacterium]|jgi:rod shape-determining protein MreC|nr:rod shape-determining protein MreC [Clostridiales Family XIII bacterium]